MKTMVAKESLANPRSCKLLTRLQLQIHPVLRPDRNNTPGQHLLLIHSQLPLKRPHHSRNQTPHLRLRKPLANTTSRPVQERHEIIVATRASIRVRLPVLGDPPLGAELRRIWPPDLGRPVDVPDGDDEVGALGDELPADLGVADRLAHG